MASRLLIAFFIFVCFTRAGILSAQVSLESEPVSWSVDAEVLGSLSLTDLDPVDAATLAVEDQVAEALARTEPMRFAYRNEVSLNTDNSGRWTNLPNGDRIWLLGIQSSGALALGLTFSTFKLPKGAAVYLYNPDRSHVIGALTEQNNKNSKVLTTDKIPGDVLIIEYYEPYAARHQGQLTIRTVAHQYREIDQNEEALTCNNNLICGTPQAQEHGSAVALITTDDGTRWCTGALVNNANFDGKPFLLTHASNLLGDPQAWHFSFRYESNSCEEVLLNRRTKSISGASLRALNEDAGVALLELSARPQGDWNVFYAGWDLSGATPQSVSTVHHPLGGVKKVTNSSQAPTPAEWEGLPVFTVESWDEGQTAEGSTGAPLFNESLRICGLFQSGFSSCDVGLEDHFSRIASARSALAPFLDPFGSGRTILNGTYFRFDEIDRDLFEEEIAIFPMPVKDQFNIVNENDEALLFVRLYDTMGRLVHEQTYTGAAIDIGDLPFGTYIVEAELASNRIRRRLIKAD